MVSNDFLSLDLVEISWFGRTSLHASCILNTRSIVEEDDHLCVVIVKLGRQVQRKLAVGWW